jgi:SAM-dependent methyltransferase
MNTDAGGGQPAARCPLCGRAAWTLHHSQVRDLEYGAPGTWAWQQCSGCALVRIDPLPSAEILAQAYPPSYHAYQSPKSAITRWLAAHATRVLARRIAALVAPGGSILDLGCAHGALLGEIGRHGDFRLYGVEFDRGMAALARQRGITVFDGSIEEAELPANSFDLVLMHHVLEHVVDPVGTLELVQRVLRPGGWLAGELPNIRSWDAALFGRLWGGGHAPRHLTHFTPATLGMALERTGFSAIRIAPTLHTGHWALSVQNWIRGDYRGGAGLVSGRAAYYPLLLLATVPINALAYLMFRTGVMRFEGRKP